MRLNRLDAFIVLLAASLVGLYVGLGGGGFPLDDSWIHQTYGRNLALLGEWALIPGQPRAASTAPFYTLLLALGYLLRIPFMLWTHFLGFIALSVMGLVGVRLAERMSPGRGVLLAGGLLVGCWHLIWAAASGMETALFAMWTLVLPFAVWRTVGGLRDGFVFGGLAALATLTRPEGVLLAGWCGLAFLVIWPRGTRRVLAWVAGAAVGFLLLMTPYLWLNWQLTGGLLPATSAAKQIQHAPLLAQPYWARFSSLLVPIFAGGQILLLPGFIWMLVEATRRLAKNRKMIVPLAMALWSLSLVALYAARLPAPYQHGRYVIPALPPIVLIGAAGTMLLVQRGRSRLVSRVITRALMVSVLVAFVAFALIIGVSAYQQDVAIINEEMVTAAFWIRDNLPEEDLLAIHDIGAVGYFAPRPLLDVAGLVTPEVIPIINDADALWELMEQRDARYLMAFTDQIPGDDPDDPRLCELFVTPGSTSVEAGGSHMVVYALAWDHECS